MSDASRKIDVLQRRADHLRRRIQSSDSDLSYDRAELSALEWAIPILESYEATDRVFREYID